MRSDPMIHVWYDVCEVEELEIPLTTLSRNAFDLRGGEEWKVSLI